MIIDSTGCPVLDLTMWGAVGPGHDSEEIVRLIVDRVNGGGNEVERRL